MRPNCDVRHPRKVRATAGKPLIDGPCVKVLAWYDNEWGYANRLGDLAERVLVPVSSSANRST
jgi:glyceraldehyde 3-phosphate dehydrogenase